MFSFSVFGMHPSDLPTNLKGKDGKVCGWKSFAAAGRVCEEDSPASVNAAEVMMGTTSDGGNVSELMSEWTNGWKNG